MSPTRSCARQAGWPLERVLFAMAGTVTLLSALLAAVVSPWFLLLTAFVGVNQWLYVLVGACPGVARARPRVRPALDPVPQGGRSSMTATYGPIGRLGRYTATHFRTVAIAWALVAVGARRLRAEGRDRAVGRRLGGHRLGVGRRAPGDRQRTSTGCRPAR